jgi:antitoxin MazE
MYGIDVEDLEMKATAQKWGNSLAIRVPKRMAEEAGLREKDAVDIEVHEGTLVVRPHFRRVYRLEDLLKRITPRNVHHELDFGGPVGRETL